MSSRCWLWTFYTQPINQVSGAQVGSKRTKQYPGSCSLLGYSFLGWKAKFSCPTWQEVSPKNVLGHCLGPSGESTGWAHGLYYCRATRSSFPEGLPKHLNAPVRAQFRHCTLVLLPWDGCAPFILHFCTYKVLAIVWVHSNKIVARVQILSLLRAFSDPRQNTISEAATQQDLFLRKHAQNCFVILISLHAKRK